MGKAEDHHHPTEEVDTTKIMTTTLSFNKPTQAGDQVVHGDQVGRLMVVALEAIVAAVPVVEAEGHHTQQLRQLSHPLMDRQERLTEVRQGMVVRVGQHPTVVVRRGMVVRATIVVRRDMDPLAAVLMGLQVMAAHLMVVHLGVLMVRLEALMVHLVGLMAQVAHMVAHLMVAPRQAHPMAAHHMVAHLMAAHHMVVAAHLMAAPLMVRKAVAVVMEATDMERVVMEDMGGILK